MLFKYTQLEVRLTKLFEKILSGSYVLDEFKSAKWVLSQHEGLFASADRLSQTFVDIKEWDYYDTLTLLDKCFFYNWDYIRASRIVINHVPVPLRVLHAQNRFKC